MQYPKDLMSITELRKMGYPLDYLRRLCHCKWADKVCIRTSRNGKFLIDTQELEKLKSKGVFF